MQPRRPFGTRDPVATAQAWATLEQRLPGRWIGTVDGTDVPVEFRIISGKSVLLETFGRPGRETITTYHLDDGDLVATHYCARGNQPRLRMRTGDARHPRLVLADVTGRDDGEPVLVELAYDLTPERGFERTEVYRQPDGKLERTVWRFAPAP